MIVKVFPLITLMFNFGLMDSDVVVQATFVQFCIPKQTNNGASTVAHVNEVRLKANNEWNESEEKKDRDMNSLTKWAFDNNFKISPRVSLGCCNDDNDYGVKIVSNDLDASESILSVPKSYVFDSKKLMDDYTDSLQSSFQYIRDAGYEDSIFHFVLMVKILEEYLLESDSNWYTWIKSLPSEFDTGVTINTVEIDCLPPFAFALANFEKQKLNTFREAFHLIPKDFSVYEVGDKGNLHEILMWVFNVVHTRCWIYDDEVATNGDEKGRPIIVPVGDMFNHREPPNVFVRDSDTSDVVEFAYTGESNANGDDGLYLSYGLTNPHRFLVIFGFCDTSMPEIFSQLIFTDPSKEMISLCCNDRQQMCYKTDDGAISNSIWDCIVYTLLNQIPDEQQRFYEAHLRNDTTEKKRYHQKYALEAALTLRPHVTQTEAELKALIDKIDVIVENINSTGGSVTMVHPRLLMIRRHNDFLYTVYGRVRNRLNQIAHTETQRRR